jgi:hypothetical protein
MYYPPRSSLSRQLSSVGIRRVAPCWEPLAIAVSEARAARKVDPDAPCVRLGRFELEQLLGCGGMGIVFRARDPELDRPVALKLWNLEVDRAEIALRHEALCQARISHPNVVTIYEAGKLGDDTYLAMEYVDGMDVRRWLRRRSMVWQQTLALFIHAGRGLAAVHSRGLVHGDFKPENVLLGRDGRVLVADFGLARAVGEFEVENGERSKTVGGTRAYMAPERLEGRLGNAWSDQFSLCVALWECLHGVRPFAGESAQELLMAMAVGKLQTGPAAVAVPELVRTVLRKGLSLDPTERYQTIDALLTELLAVPTRVHRRRRRRVLGVAAAVVGMVAFVVQGRAEAPADDDAAHIEVGIIPDAEPTLLPSPSALTVDELVEMVARGQLDEAHARWTEWQRVGWDKAESSAIFSLHVATAFLDEAARLEQQDPETALRSARFALQVAVSVPLELEATEEDAAEADELTARAASLIVQLAPIVASQPKQSTVPSTLE